MADLVDFFPITWLPGHALEPSEVVTFTPFHRTWADDVFLTCTAASANVLHCKVEVLAALAIDTAASFGLKLNDGEDKTEALLVLRNAGTHSVLRSLSVHEPFLVLRTQALEKFV